MNKGALILLIFIAGTFAVMGEYHIAVTYYPEGCCRDLGSLMILAGLIATMGSIAGGCLLVAFKK